MRSRLLAVDPGINGSGVAFFENAKLSAATWVPNQSANIPISQLAFGGIATRALGMATAIQIWLWDFCAVMEIPDLVIEWPRIYTADKQKGDQNDLLPLVGVGMALAGILHGHGVNVTSYFPHEWKGQMPKEACGARVHERLSPEEMAKIVVRRASMNHNTLDAIGIGLHHLGRFAPRKVYPR